MESPETSYQNRTSPMKAAPLILASTILRGNAFCPVHIGSKKRSRISSRSPVNVSRRHNALAALPLVVGDGSSLWEQLSQAGSPLVDSVDAKSAGIALAASVAFIVASSNSPPSKLISSEVLDSIVQGTFLQRAQNLRCVYKASRDGWSALDFHKKVDDMGSSVVVALSTSRKVFGGYNPSGWRSSDDYYTSTSAFLWCLRGNNKVVKLPVLTGGNAAVFDYATGGPCFSSDLQIGPPQAAVLGGFAGPDMEDLSINAGSLRQGKSSVGITYEWDDAWPARGSFRLVDMEVYCNAP